MALKLHLGITDIPYSQALAQQSSGKRAISHATSSTTTGDVAEYLEARYSIMHHFWELHGHEAAEAITEIMQGKLESLMMGGPASDELFSDSDFAPVEQMFRDMLDNKELDGKVNGVPTLASLAGVNHRLRHPYSSSNPVRPSFVDSGLYQASFKAWISEE